MADRDMSPAYQALTAAAAGSALVNLIGSLMLDGSSITNCAQSEFFSARFYGCISDPHDCRLVILLAEYFYLRSGIDIYNFAARAVTMSACQSR